MAQSLDVYEGIDRSQATPYGWELNLSGLAVGKTFLSYMNQIPAYIKRDIPDARFKETSEGVNSAPINVVLQVAPGPMICRGTVVKIIG